MAEEGIVPKKLNKIERCAEDVIDQIMAGNWDKADVSVTSIATTWADYQIQASKDGATAATLETLSTALKRLQEHSSARRAHKAMCSANDICGAVMDLFALYHPKIPVEIGRLDVLERRVLLDAMADDLNAKDAIAGDLANVVRLWETVKPSVLVHKGEAVARQFDTSLAKQKLAIDGKNAAAAKAEAENALELVDALEKLYE